MESASLEDFHPESWSPARPTAIVIDYAAHPSYSAIIAKLLQTFRRRREEFLFEVRVLLVERFAEGQPWYDQLCGKGSGEG